MTSLAISYSELKSEVGFYLGFTRDTTSWTAGNLAEVVEYIKGGVRQFYWPPPLSPQETGGKPQLIRWSFMSPQATLSVSNGTFLYELPANFGGTVRSMTYADNASASPLTPVDEERLRALQAGNHQSARPSYYAVRPKTSDGADEQKWEVLLYPTPNQGHSILYRYDVAAQVLTDAKPYPLGGAAHSETLLESCLAVAEERKGDHSAVHRKRFQELLAASAQYDARVVQEGVRDTWTVEQSGTTLDVTYSDLLRHVGQFLGFGWDRSSWTRDQLAVADDLVQSGLRQFYRPPAAVPEQPVEGKPAPKQPKPHKWSFLALNSTLAVTTAVDSYTMPAAFNGELVGDITYSYGDQQVHIKQVTDDLLRDLQADTTTSTKGPPQYVSIRPRDNSGTARQGWQMVFYPKPDAAYTLNYQYITIPPRLTDASPYPLGSVDHAETILASCLAAAEERMRPESNTFRQRFAQRLVASITVDSKDKPSGEAWPLGDLGDTTLDVTYDQLLKRVGHELGIGWIATAWSIEERRRVDMVIQSGLRRFYFPPPVGRERFGHEWSFLRPIATLTTGTPYSTGTVTVASGVVTLLGGTWPSWAGTGYLTAGSLSLSPVSVRTNGTSITLTDTTATVAAGSTFILYPPTAYDLPTDFAAIDGPMTFQPGDSVLFRPVEIIGEHQIRQRLAQLTTSYRPQAAAIRPKAIDETTWTKFEILFYPVPDAAYTLTYRYRVNILALSDARQYPPGAQPHAETILESCLASAERMRDSKDGVHEKKFQELLLSSVSSDRQHSAPAFLGYNRDCSDAPDDPYSLHGYHMTDSVVTYNGVSY